MHTSTLSLATALLFAATTKAAPTASVGVHLDSSSMLSLFGPSLLSSIPCKPTSGSHCSGRDLASQAAALAKNVSALTYGFDFASKNLYALSSNVSQVATKLSTTLSTSDAHCHAATHDGSFFFFDIGCMGHSGSAPSNSAPQASATNQNTATKGPTGTQNSGPNKPTVNPVLQTPTIPSNLNDIIAKLTKEFNGQSNVILSDITKFLNGLNNNAGTKPSLEGVATSISKALTLPTGVAACTTNLLDCLPKIVPSNIFLVNQTCGSSGSKCSSSEIQAFAAQLANSLQAPAYAYTNGGSAFALSVDASQFAKLVNPDATIKSAGNLCQYASLPLLNDVVSVFDRGCGSGTTTTTTAATNPGATLTSAINQLVNITTTQLKNGLGGSFISNLVNSGSIISGQQCTTSQSKICSVTDLYNQAKSLATSTGAKAFGYTTDGKILSLNSTAASVASTLNSKLQLQVKGSACSQLNLLTLVVFDAGCTSASSTTS